MNGRRAILSLPHVARPLACDWRPSHRTVGACNRVVSMFTRVSGPREVDLLASHSCPVHDINDRTSAQGAVADIWPRQPIRIAEGAPTMLQGMTRGPSTGYSAISARVLLIS